MKYPLNSNFSKRIMDFVHYKHSLGHSYEESCRLLWKFDIFCTDRFPEKTSFDRDVAMAWLEMRDTEGKAGHRNRIMVLREFARYLNAIGDNAYLIPISMTTKGKRYIPHIFTASEIAAFFYGADHFAPHEKAPARHFIVPVFFRLLYCCGLRPSEARLLRKESVDLVRGTVHIEESKGHKDRVIVVADDLLHLMQKYFLKVNAIYPDCPFFFPRYDGMGAYSKLWTEKMFWLCFKTGGVTQFDGPRPRVYDFRHTFATECIYRWIQEGKNVDAMLPFLSAYMGHARYEDTVYYIHMIPDFYQRTGKIDIATYESLLPEVYDESDG